MGTKNNPGKFDAYAKALQDEPTFTLLARDPMFSKLVLEWADNRADEIHCGLRPESDEVLVREAYSCADQAQKWRKENNGAWRKPQEPDATYYSVLLDEKFEKAVLDIVKKANLLKTPY